MFINVLEPDTINDPVIIAKPPTLKNGVIVTPELLDMVPAGPIGPIGPTGPEGPGAVTTTTLVLVSVVTMLFILLLL